MHYSVVIMSLYCYNIQRRAYNMACPFFMRGHLKLLKWKNSIHRIVVHLFVDRNYNYIL